MNKTRACETNNIFAVLGRRFTTIITNQFCFFLQISMAARLVRETPTENSDFLANLGNKLQKGLEAGQQQFQATFTQENFNVSIL